MLRPCVLVAAEYGLHPSYTNCSFVVIAFMVDVVTGVVLLDLPHHLACVWRILNHYALR